ncbi:Ubiquitin-conjugating enzyme subunit [Ophidiomyces ophidiicola]|nr:Ubiquitin-conjugating enzyme subunit [Ophidiomyces ophidiicola]KAI1943539.1 Ubiquitin-conjugating enzyme subunit [Ophidiomyces ophidiicola]KAI1964087.1 Ubiquitin-conjugating enzyme subunit [Ophidiomyces ophidiicola]
MAERILVNEFKILSKEKWVDIELRNDDIFNWNVALIVLNPDSLYYGGYFKGCLVFPRNYPYSPPTFKFLKPIFHPNVYENGEVCISILHAPGDDELSGESASERWSPAQRVESVLISIISLLDDAEINSPANVSASVMLRDNPNEYKVRASRDVEKSKLDIPEGFVMPTHETSMAEPEKPEIVDEDFWIDSDCGDDDDIFGGSDSDDIEYSHEDNDSSSDAEE